LNYLTGTFPDIPFAISVTSQFLNFSCVDHWNPVFHILKYIKNFLRKGLLYGHSNHTRVLCCSDVDWARSPFDRRSTSGYCVSIGDNLISWKSKKQNVITRFSVKTEYSVITSTTRKIIWLKQLLKELQFVKVIQMTLICDNHAPLH